MNKEREIQKTINEQKEWQEHQFDPGYFLGGNIPSYILRKNKKLGIALLIVGFTQLILMVVGFQAFNVAQIVILLVITILMIFAGYQKLKGN